VYCENERKGVLKMDVKTKVKDHKTLTPVFVIRARVSKESERPHWVTVGYVYPEKFRGEELELHLNAQLKPDWEKIRLVPPDPDDIKDAQNGV
jgi:hypothetical protein